MIIYKLIKINFMSRVTSDAGLEKSDFPPVFSIKFYIFNDHCLIHRLAHIIDRQGGNRYGGQRFHLGAGFSLKPHLGMYPHSALLVIQVYDDINKGERQRDGTWGSVRRFSLPP